MKISDFKDKKITVMGLGLQGGGVGTARWLARQGARVLVTDLKTEKELAKSLKELEGLDIKYVLSKHREEDFKNVDLIIKNPGVPRDSKFLKIARENNIPITTDINIFFELCPAPIIGITGTKGKTTTATLLGKIFTAYNPQSVIAGNIRKPVLDFLEKIDKDTPIVLELSSWQLEGLEEIKKSPRLALITNIFVDHLNRYEDLEDYKNAKKFIYKYQTPKDVIILNRDNFHTKRMYNEAPSQCFWFSKKYFKWENGVCVRWGQIIFRHEGKRTEIMPVKEIKVPGDHNLENVLGAITLAMVYGVPVEIIRETVKNFRGVENRTELTREVGGVKYYNDTTATAPEAVINSLKTLGRKKNIILIAGGADKELYFKDMARQIKKRCKRVVLLPGTATEKINEELIDIKYPASNIQPAANMTDAVRKARNLAEAGDIVLLSPGCASFGIFINEFDRGEQFVKEVGAIIRSIPSTRL